jgi:serine/threonine protein kinase
LRLERRVALKQLRPPAGLSGTDEALANQRAMREARITARLHHRYAVPVFDVVEHDGQPCLIMQFIPSVPLAAVLREGGPLLPGEAAQVGALVGSAVAAAHEVGIIHRDVKPGNILIADDGSSLISDFGISHALGDATLTDTGMVHGTPAFLSPEVAQGGTASYASDVFSLGATLYAALEGTPPFGTDANSIVLLHRVAAGRFDPPQRSGALTPLLVSMLSASPADRPTMSTVARALTVLSAPETPVEPTVELAAPSAPTIDQTHAGTGWAAASGSMGAEASVPTVITPPRVRDGTVTEVAAPDAARAPARRRMSGVVALAAVAVVLLVVVALLVLREPGGTDARVGASGTTQSASPVPSPVPSAPHTTESASRTESLPSTVSVPPSRTVTTPTPTQPTSTPVKGKVSDSDLAGAIRSYYALLPANTAEAWPGMTTSYQVGHAGGRGSYDAFWGAIRRVSASNITGAAPDRATATITYVYRNGRRVRERTSFQLVKVGGRLKINDSTVLSSN